MERTFIFPMICLASLLCCTTNQVLLTVRPSRSQHFEQDSLTLSCKNDDDAAKWLVWRNTTEGEVSQCGNKWGGVKGATCMNTLALSYDSGVYWCESKEGVQSSRIQITVTSESVILDSPVTPVMEGDNITLSCLTKSSTVHHSATFYKDGSLIKTEPKGQMTFHHVSRSDGGLYYCKNSHGESPASWLCIKERPTSTPLYNPTTSLIPVTPHVPSSLQIRLLCHLVVFCPFVISTLLFVSLYQLKNR
ncbi:high affinity immunoglobulin gamma Fc receptor I-like [Cyprinodon tularosa]|uniref:high affinity immunoglobulin gamma Fc receptor I-like n=1 Tax=Cyprinodon tularosa TaxID=77115 RepID=UPI0018E28846|nr:high affinity immunoglobulin gamma Fc receptor I-like [Cyprinodon tularosa]